MPNWRPFAPPRLWSGTNRWGYAHQVTLLHAEERGLHWRRAEVRRDGLLLWAMEGKTESDVGALERRMMKTLAETLGDDELGKAMAGNRTG